MTATHFTQPIDYTGDYRGWWAGYKFKEELGYTSGRHTGVDYNWGGYDDDLGRPIRSIASGIVRWTGSNPTAGFGNVTIIEHPLSTALKNELGCDSLFSRYLHQNNISVSPGQSVSIGQEIGTVGKTGTQWAHLHIDLYKSTIDGGGVHFRYDKDTQLASYLDVFEFIESHNTAPVEVPTLSPTQAMLLSDAATNLRSSPRILPDNIVKELPADFGYVDCIGIVRGDSVNGSDIWVQTWSGNYIHGSRLVALPTAYATPPVETTPVTPTPEIPKYEPISQAELMQVINKKHALPSSYVPSDLVSVGVYKMKGEVAAALKQLQEAAKAAGHTIPVVSGYRSYDEQQKLYAQYVAADGQTNADTYSARAGHSEHQTGLAVDLCSVEDTFANDPRAKWLSDNAQRFGFILRYPKGKETITGYRYEPWHFRYVGKTAPEITSTLEEYTGVIGGDYVVVEPGTPEIPDYSQENNAMLKLILSIVKAISEQLNKIFK